LAALLDQAHHMVLPALTLTLAYIGEYMIVMRSSMLDTVGEDYLQLARAKGLRDAAVRKRHAVPNAMLPVVSLTALNFGFILSGAIAVEAIFSWPGLGQATLEAIRGPDFPMLQGLFLLFSASLIVANLAVDLLYGYLDPRVDGRSATSRSSRPTTRHVPRHGLAGVPRSVSSPEVCATTGSHSPASSCSWRSSRWPCSRR
jgi:peptide/nickel transport system permease protein